MQDRFDEIVSSYTRRLESTELLILFPFVLLFFLISIASTIIYPFVKVNLPSNSNLFYWSLIPTSFYGLIFYFLLTKTKAINSCFYFYRASIPPKQTQKVVIFRSLNLVFSLASTFGFFDGFFTWKQQSIWAADGLRLCLVSGLLICIFILIFIWDSRFPSFYSRAIFISVILLTFIFIDSVEQTVQGRSLMFLLIPILLSSFLIVPAASFITAIAIVGLLTFRSYSVHLGLNSTAYLGIIVLSLITWIITDGWEKAVNERQFINDNLERIIYSRTIQLSRANAFKSTFLAQIAHELQSPIVAFSMFLRKIKDLISDDEFEALSNETHRVLEMTKAISEVAKVELELVKAEEIELEKIKIDKELISVIQVMNIVANEKRIEIILSLYVEHSIAILGNRDVLRRIFHNLIGNAIKYSKNDSEIFIEVDIKESWIVIKIIDSGIGIPEAELPYIFGPFSRASNVGDVPGTGLGLSMVKDLIEVVNGSIEIESILGKGTTVTVRLPWVN